MAGRKNVAPLTDLQQQFKDIVEPILEQITIDKEPLDTISSYRLQEVLLERDLDDILCLKDLYSEDLNLEEKADEVYNILQEILDSDTKPSSVDKLIEQLIQDCVVFNLKVKKRKELVADFQRSFNGLTTKEEISNTRKKIKKTTTYKEVEQESEKASSNRRKVKKKQKTANKITKTEEALKSASEILEKSQPDVSVKELESLVKLTQDLLNNITRMKQKELNNEAVANKEKTGDKAQSVSVEAT